VLLVLVSPKNRNGREETMLGTPARWDTGLMKNAEMGVAAAEEEVAGAWHQGTIFAAIVV